ncbi:MAG: redox-active protein [Bacteroidales bacterium]|jgi:hypothetical protein|nr:redox-active protein [Bacteroidales bacterium]
MAHSEKFFHAAPENHNCAQAVLKGFEREYSIAQSQIDAYRAFGGGRAPQGVCGALFAAQQLSPEKAEKLQVEFVSRCGSAYCKDIKAQGRVSCTECVKIADELLEQAITE